MNFKFQKGEKISFYLGDNNDKLAYGIVDDMWSLQKENNYVIKDICDIYHERYEYEIEKIEDIDLVSKKSNCIISLETLLNEFAKLNQNYSLNIKIKQAKDCSGDFVPYIFVRYVDNEEKTVYIDDNGKFFVPDENYVQKNGEYECCLFYYDTNFKDAIFELYTNIYLRLKKQL